MESSEPPPEARRQRWLSLAKANPPEWLAAFVESPRARWVVVTEEGSGRHLVRRSAYLLDIEDLPYWAFALAKCYLDDVGEWPLFGMQAEAALQDFADHQDPLLAVPRILAAIKPVWPDVVVTFVGEEQR
ncbi:MAG: hypothetical protein HQL57_11200 [Magnetococcales bacterium]|nr:hypothetical protein [Magnetococcales bacterium]MBF0157741.1 hypothetical protein [Magnetococcales bacterium]